jgi:flagellar hook-associated protein 2
VQTGAGYRLQISASATGAASAFTLSGLAGTTPGTDILTQGTNAAIKVGKNTTYSVTSATNTFAGLVPGLSFVVSKEETGVTVGATVDGSAVADKVSKLVDSANSILSDIATKSTYSTTTKTGGPFTGESTVRSLQQNILSTASAAGAAGVSLTRDGKLSFDRASFLTSFASDPAKVAQSFGATSTFAASSAATSTTATVSSALKSARAGTYAVKVTAAATRDQWSVDGSAGLSGKALTLTRGTDTVSYTVLATDTLDTAATAFNAASAAGDFGVTATVSGTNLLFTADDMGAARAFSATVTGLTPTRVTTGVDVAGSIDGQTANGLGNVLSLPTGTGGAVGLSVAVSTTTADVTASGGAIGSITFKPGLAQRLSTLMTDATAGTGSVSTAKDGANAEVKRYQKTIDDWDARLTAYRATLTTQFTAMETALAKLKTATSALSQLTSSSSSSSNSSN